MQRNVLFIATLSILYILTSAPLYSAQPVAITEELTQFRFGQDVEYYEDAEGALNLKDIMKKQDWRQSQNDSLNFGFTQSAYWFRFTVDNRKTTARGWYLQIDYPALDSISLYYPLGGGQYAEKKTGDRLPFDKRDVVDRKFVFDMSLPKGKHEIFIRCKTTGTMNVTPSMISHHEFAKKLEMELPVWGIYFGIIIVMIIYNLFLFISMRELSYLSFSIYLLMFLLYDATLNGFAFQYLWPDSTWMANNILPFFMAQSIAWVSLFCSFYIDTPKKYPRYFKIVLFTVIIPLMLVSLIVFTGNNTLSIKLSAAVSLLGIVIVNTVGWILMFKKSRESLILCIAFLLLFFGILLFTMKTAGVLPSMFITDWGYQIGIIFVVLILSFGLAHKVNIMKKDLIKLNVDLKDSEKLARDRTQFLENAVANMKDISQELYNVSGELSTIGNSFENLATEQASTSEQMAASFEELTSSNERVYDSTVNQKEESKRTKDLVTMLTNSQKNVARVSLNVLEGITVITESAKDTGNNLALMIERMEHIDRGGKAIDGITALIDDITDRINLLSLNAAIEAARAGAAGRGFSVVADEISKLASATSDNSKEISAQLKNMINDINTGKSIVDKTKSSLDTIFARIDDINKRIDETKTVFTYQGEAIGEVMDQTSVMESLSNDIANATKEHSISMEENIKIVNRLADIAQEIARSTKKILNSTKIIGEKSGNLEGLIENIS